MAGADTGVLELPYGASGAITKMRFVTLNGDQVVKQADAAGQRALGVMKVDISAGEAALGKGGAVQVLGVAWVSSDAAITRGAVVGSSADGQAKTAVATEVPLGIALKAATAADQLIPVLLTPGLPALA